MMKKKTFLLVATVLLMSLPLLVVAQENKSADEAAIRQTVQFYVDGWRNNDAESIEKAFHPKAKIFSQTDKAYTGKSDLRETTGTAFLFQSQTQWSQPTAQALHSEDPVN